MHRVVDQLCLLGPGDIFGLKDLLNALWQFRKDEKCLLKNQAFFLSRTCREPSCHRQIKKGLTAQSVVIKLVEERPGSLDVISSFKILLKQCAFRKNIRPFFETHLVIETPCKRWHTVQLALCLDFFCK